MEYDTKYFERRGLEQKHWLMSQQWINYFNLDENSEVFDFGCGRGPYVHAFRYLGVPKTIGTDIAKEAIMNPIGLAGGNIFQNDEIKIENKSFDLVMCLDVFEHLDLENISSTIEKLISSSRKYILLSVCCYGDPNFENDPTHKTKRTYDWWVHQFVKHGCKHIPTPRSFLFYPQLFIFEVG